MRSLALSIALSAATVAQSAAVAVDAERGHALYESRCGGCHSLDGNRTGPSHRGVFGRAAGSVASYAYSPALRDARLEWDAATLDRWLANPERLVPGQRMNYSVSDAEDRADLIAYLRRAH